MFSLPELPYTYDALEPYISADIQHLHHDKHHQAYVDNLNKALENEPSWQDKNIVEILKQLDQLPDDIKTVVKNNAGGHFNHSLFWNMMTPIKQEPNAILVEEINKNFGSLTNFKDQFSQGAVKVFGSGWQWLVQDGDDLKLIATPNQDSPISQNLTPLLGLDVWEHAYYLQYYNKRADYITAWWNIVNWEYVANQLKK